MELVYFPLLARNVLTLLLARDAGLDVAQRAVDWPAYKGETMFGQLPQLEGEGVPGGKMGQSMAIARFLARKAKRDGATDAEESDCTAIALSRAPQSQVEPAEVDLSEVK